MVLQAVDVKEPFSHNNNIDSSGNVSNNIKSKQSTSIGNKLVNGLSHIYNSSWLSIPIVKEFIPRANPAENSATSISDKGLGQAARCVDRKNNEVASFAGSRLMGVGNWMRLAVAGLYSMGMIQSLSAADVSKGNRPRINDESPTSAYRLIQWDSLSSMSAATTDIAYIMENQGYPGMLFVGKNLDSKSANPYSHYSLPSQHLDDINESRLSNTIDQRHNLNHPNAIISVTTQLKDNSTLPNNIGTANAKTAKEQKSFSSSRIKYGRKHVSFPRSNNMNKLENQLQTKMAEDEYPISEKNLNPGSYKNCEVFRIYTKDNQEFLIPTEKQTVKINNKWFRVKLNTIRNHGVKYEVPSTHANKFYSIACHDDHWHFEKPTSPHATDELVAAITPEFFAKHINAYYVSAPTKDGLQWRNNKSYLRIKGKLVKLTKSQFKENIFYIEHAKTNTLILVEYHQAKFHFSCKIRNSTIPRQELRLKWVEIRVDRITKHLENAKKFIAKRNILNSFRHLIQALKIQNKYDLGQIDDICKMSLLAVKQFMNFPDEETMYRANVNEIRQVWQSILQPLQEKNKLTKNKISHIVYFFSRLSKILTTQNANSHEALLYKNHYLALLAAKDFF